MSFRAISSASRSSLSRVAHARDVRHRARGARSGRCLVDADLFTGNPDWSKLLAVAPAT